MSGQESGRYPQHEEWQPGVLSDRQIQHLCEHHQMIVPFEADPVREAPGGFVVGGQRTSQRVVSYGLGHYGYDIRVSREFRVFTPVWNKSGEAVVDPKDIDSAAMVNFEGDVCRIPPNSFALARSVERFKIPRDVLGVVLGKSTYARCGLIVNCTPLEPEWEGWLTIEISNTTPLPAKVYGNEGIAQILFYKASAECVRSYRDKGGKYQDQPEQIVLPRM